MIKYLTCILFLFILAGLSETQAQQERKYIRSGNDYYNEALDDSLRVDSSLMQKSEVEYRKAIEKKPSTFEGRNNLGNSLYRQKKYDEAINEWKSLTSLNIDERKKGKVYHNLGNAFLMNNKLEKSIEAYKNALRNYPGDTATKYNLAFAQSKLKEQQKQQQKQNKQNQQKNKDQKDQQKNKQKQDQQKQDQQKQKKQQQKEQQQKQQQKQQQQQQKQGEKKKGKQGEKKEKISKKDAMRILKALQMDEKQLQKKLKRLQKKQSKSKKTDKDW